MNTQLPNFENPLTWVLLDQNGYIYEEDLFVGALMHNQEGNPTVNTELNYLPEQQEKSSPCSSKGDSDDFEWIGSDEKEENKSQIIPTPAQQQWATFSSTNPIWHTILESPGTARSLSESTYSSSPISNLRDKSSALPDYSDRFPKELIQWIGSDNFSQIPFYELSEKRIEDIEATDLTASFMIFSPSKERYSGIAMLTSLNDNLQIEVYYGDKTSTNNWYLSIMPLEKISKKKCLVLTPSPKNIEKNRHDKQPTDAQHLAAQLCPISINLASHQHRITALCRQKEFREEGRTTYLSS